MNENKSVPAVGKTAVQPLYSHPYYARDGKLYIEKQSKSGLYLEQLCNFTPRIVLEVTFDDGQTVRKEYRIGGEDEYGNPLHEVDVAADDLSRMDWLANHWPATLRLSVVSSVEKHVQCAMKETAVYAEQNEVFTITTKALAKQLSEEGLIEVTDSGKNTRSIPFGGINKRVMLLKRNAVKDILDGI